MNEQFYIDWVNSTYLPEQIFINKIEDLYDNDVLLNLISYILNKQQDELLLIIGSKLSPNMLENISSLMDMYFSYKFNYTNKQTLKYNTIKLLQFLKSRYQETINDDETNSPSNSQNIIEKNSLDKINKNENNDNLNENINKDLLRSNEKLKYNNNILIESNNSIKSSDSPFLINSSNNQILNKELNIDEKKLESKKYNESRQIPNYITKIFGISILDKTDNSFFYYKLLKPTNPLIKINLENISPKVSLNYLNKNMYYCLPYFLKKLTVKGNEEKILNKTPNKNSNCSFDKNKLKFTIDYLYENKILTNKQKNEFYLKKYFVPQLRDGFKFGKIINLLENKTENYLKGITNETFYKSNIFYNWKNIFEFLSKKNNFYSIYLFEENFYENNIKLFNFLYDVLQYYHKNKTHIFKNKSTLNKMHNNQNISLNNYNDEKIIKNTPIKSEHFPKKIKNLEVEHDSTTYGRRLKNNHSFLKTNSNNKENNKISTIKKNLNKNYQKIPSLTELMNIRRNINYHHKIPKKQNTFVERENFTNIESLNKCKIKGEDEKFDVEVIKIMEFLEKIGMDTSNINFYEPEMKIFKDGIFIYQIIKQIENNISLLPKIDFHPRKPSTAVNNHRLILNFLEKYKTNFPVKFVSEERELYKANPEFILKFLQVIKDVYKNEIHYKELLNKKREINYGNDVKKINHKNIDISEMDSLPLTQEMREKFIETDNLKYWA